MTNPPKIQAMTQHDLFANPNRRRRGVYPMIVALQANAVGGESAIVAPLTPVTALTPVSRLLPIIAHGDQRYVVVFSFVTNIPARLLRHPVGSIASYREDLTRALDWLFFGI
jgi:toxin CcdB